MLPNVVRSVVWMLSIHAERMLCMCMLQSKDSLYFSVHALTLPLECCTSDGNQICCAQLSQPV